MSNDLICDVASAEYARRSFKGFIERMMPNFTIPKHIHYLIGHLEAVERGDYTNLMINTPPRHAKSLLCSRLFPAWCIGRDPKRRIILASGDQELSEGNSRAIRTFITDEGLLWPFPEVKTRPDSTSVRRWDLINGGGLFATSAESEPAGRGATMLIIDDIAKTSGTEGYRANVMRFYREDLVSRLEGKNPLTIAIGTGSMRMTSSGRSCSRMAHRIGGTLCSRRLPARMTSSQESQAARYGQSTFRFRYAQAQERIGQPFLRIAVSAKPRRRRRQPHQGRVVQPL